MTEFKNDLENTEEEMVSADQADAAIAEAVKKALAETDNEDSDTDEVTSER